MARLLRRQLRFWVRSLWGAVLFLIIALAVMVQLGRALFPVLNDYRGEMEQALSAQLGVQVEVANISAKWTGLRPRVTFSGVKVRNRADEPVFQVDAVSAEVSLLSTLRDWRLGFRKVTFNGMSAALSQNDRGGWWVQGLERAPSRPQPNPSRQPRFRDPIDIFLFGRRVELRDTRLTLLFRSGLSTEVAVPFIRLENDAQFHRLTASFGVDTEQQSLDWVVEGKGDPRDEANFDARGYVHLQRFPSAKVLAALGIREDVLLPDGDPAADAAWRDDGLVNLSLWFQGTSSRGVNLNGELAVEGSPLQPPAGMQWPTSLGARFSGSWEPQRGWTVKVADARLRWPDLEAPPLFMTLEGGLEKDTEIAVASLDLARWGDVVQRAGALQGHALEAFEALRPQGELRNLHLLLKSADAGHFALRANLLGGRVGAWQGAPALTGVTGFVEADAAGGQILLRSEDGFVLDFPRLYNQPLSFDEASGAVRWKIDMDKRTVYVSSSLVKLANREVSARGHFNLHLPIDHGGEPEMTLVVGVREGHADLHRSLVPYTAPEPLLQWLDRAIIAGDVHDAGFIYHGSLLKDATIARVMQLRGRVDNAEVAFDPAWPAVRDASGLLYLDDLDFSVTGLSGHLGQVEVRNARVDLVHLDESRRAIRVQAAATGDSAQASELLAQTPLRGLGGDEVASWQWQGPLSAILDVQVPLERDQQDGSYQKVELQFAGNQLRMPGIDLTFTDVSGPLVYDSNLGLSSAGLEARLWNEPVQATMRTEQSASGRELVADLSGRVEMAAVQAWTRRPELGFVSGGGAVNGQLRVPLSGDANLRLVLDSTLEGVAMVAPPPLNKPAAQSLPLRVLVENRKPEEGASRFRYSFALADVAELRLSLRGGTMRAADLTFGQAKGPLRTGVFWVRGPLAQADAMQWRDTLERYLAAVKTTAEKPAEANTSDAAAASEAKGLPTRVDLQIGQFQAGDLVLEDVNFTAREDDGVWRLGLSHPTLAGSVTLAPGDAPLGVDIERLYLPENEPDAGDSAEASQVVESDGIEVTGDPFVPGPQDFWRSLDLATVPAADVRIADLRAGDRQLGRWEMKLRTIERGLLAYDLKADSVGLTIEGRGKPGAEVIWTRTPSGDNTYFSGVVRARNLAETFRQLGFEPALTSDSARFDVDLQWPAPPVEVDLLKLAGVVDLKIERGVFSRAGSVGENPLLKLIGLLNFDTLARRLRLDFSDLSVAGLAYEEIDGTLLFRSGTVAIRQPLQVSTPSSHLQLVGDLDMERETLDTQLVATLPLAGNLTVAAALTGGVPLAIGVYVAGKIFKDQVERVSSLRYNVTGSWNDPQAKLERIFENTVAEPEDETQDAAPAGDSP